MNEKIAPFDDHSDQVHKWLENSPTPSIRYLAQRWRKKKQDRQLEASHKDVMTSGPVPAILSGQTEKGSWSGEHSYYTPKYISTHWSLLLLAELEIDAADTRFQRGINFMLSATEQSITKRLAENEHGLSCFWGNLLRYVLHAGRSSAPRVDAITQYLVQDSQVAWRCQHNDELPCAWGCARALWALAAIPETRRTAPVQATIERGICWLLEENQLLSANYPTPGKIHPLWFRLNFPLFYQADILFVLRTLWELGRLDHPGARPALEWLHARRDRQGRWRGASPFRRRTWQEIGDREDTNRWVTLIATQIINDAQLEPND